MKRKLLQIVASTVVVVSLLVGCGGNTNTASTTDDSSKDVATADTSDGAEASADTTNEVTPIKWVQVGTGMPTNYDSWLGKLNPYLEEKISVNVDMEIVPWADWEGRRSLIVNSGEEFDILFTDQVRYNAEVAIGAFMDITDILPEAVPDLYNMIPEEYWLATSVNGRIYSVPTYKDSSATMYYVWDRGMAEKYGIDIESISNYEELYPALKTIREGENTNPYLMARGGADYLSVTYYDQIGVGLVPIGIHYQDETRTVVNPMAEERVLEQMDIVHQMYKDGIINGDAPNAEEVNEYRTFFHGQGWSIAAQTVWGPRNGVEDCVAIKYSDTVISNTTVRGSLNGIYSGSKNPEKALELLQLVNTDTKVRDMYYYGEEGGNFEYTDDGKLHRLNADWSMAGYTQGTFFNISQLDTDEVNQWDEVKELNSNAVPSVALGMDVDISNVETEVANCRAVYEKYSREFWTGAREPRELSKIIQEELEAAGWETIRAEAQAQVDAHFNQ